MLTEIVLSYGEADSQTINFEELFNINDDRKLKNIKSIKAKADTSEMSLSYLGDFLPKLQIMRLDYSNIMNLRDLSTHLPNLRILYLTHCKLTSIEGISTISCKIQELYLSFNLIDDISPLLDFDLLTVLDLESNLIKNVNDVSLLKCCNSISDLTLRGNAASENPNYRSMIKELIPQLTILDGVKFCNDKSNHFEKSSKLPQISTQSFHHTYIKIDEKLTQKTKLPLLKANNPIKAHSNVKKQIRSPKVLHNLNPLKH